MRNICLSHLYSAIRNERFCWYVFFACALAIHLNEIRFIVDFTFPIFAFNLCRLSSFCNGFSPLALFFSLIPSSQFCFPPLLCHLPPSLISLLYVFSSSIRAAFRSSKRRFPSPYLWQNYLISSVVRLS